MTARRRAVTISAATLAAAATLVTACTPIVNSLIDHLWPGTKPIAVLPVSETPSGDIRAMPDTAPAPPSRNSLPARDLPY